MLKRAHAEREREKERRDLDAAFQTTPQRMDTYTHKVMLKYPFGKYSGKHSRLCLELKYTAEKNRMCVRIGPCI